MSVDSDKVNLIAIRPQVSSYDEAQELPMNILKKENFSKETNEKPLKSFETVESGKIPSRTTIGIEDESEERQRTGRYLAVGVTLIMLFIAFYNTVLRHATVLAGLLAPAIIMLLYILWLLYFAKKRKTQVSSV